MSSFLRYVLWELKNSLALVILAAIFASFTLIVAYLIYKKKHRGEKKFPWGKVILYFIMAAYLLVVLYATILRHAGGYREWNLHLFRAWREAWNDFSVKSWANVLLNVAMFVPMGFLLPLFSAKVRKWYITIPVCLAASFAIEFLQLIFSRGICDVDDLFANTLGAVIGYFAAMTIQAIISQKGSRLKPAITYGSLTMIPVVAIALLFAVYNLKEYGNFPNAAAYRNNTNNVRWTLDCELPKINGLMGVYKTQPRSKKDCDALAKELAALIGEEVLMASYYQEMAYYNLSQGLLEIYYFDGSYEISSHYGEDTTCPVSDRTSVEAALSHFGISIPVSADYLIDEKGWYSFICDHEISGSMMYDGILRCRYSPDGAIRNINNHLVSYSHYKEVSIISPQEAYEQLCSGKFNDGGYFEYKKPKEISVTDCLLDYQIDTKGFYRPVYLFTVVSNDGDYQYDVMIPAM